jgi:hypothetical protein
MLEIYDRTTQQFIPITPAIEPEYQAIMDCWKEDSGDPRTLPEFLACFCDVVTGRIDETVTATDDNWAGLTLQYMDLSQARPS